MHLESNVFPDLKARFCFTFPTFGGKNYDIKRKYKRNCFTGNTNVFSPFNKFLDKVCLPLHLSIRKTLKTRQKYRTEILCRVEHTQATCCKACLLFVSQKNFNEFNYFLIMKCNSRNSNLSI